MILWRHLLCRRNVRSNDEEPFGDGGENVGFEFTRLEEGRMLFYSFREAARGSVVWRRGIEKRERGSWDGMVLSSYYFKVKKRPILGRMKSYKVDEVHKPPRLGRFQKRQYSENDMQSDATQNRHFRGERNGFFLVDFDAHIRCERGTADF